MIPRPGPKGEIRGYENPNSIAPPVPGWRSFLKREAFFRHKYHSLVPAHPCVDIMHGDLECRYTHPSVDGHSVAFLNYPWLRPNRESTPASYRVLTTDLKEKDVVGGAAKLAAESLELGIRELESEAFVVINSACVPDVIGENLEQIVRPYEGQAPIFYHQSDGKDQAPVVVSEMIRLAGPESKAERAARAGGAGRGAVSLLGVPGGRVEGELRALLREAGVRVAASVVPALSPARIRAARQAACHILFPNRLYDELYREVTLAVDLPVVVPSGPYGMDGTARWVFAVAEAAGVAGWERAVARGRRTYARQWEQLRGQARRQRLGFVVDASEVAMLSDSALNAGVPLVALLKEMGFSLDLLIYDDGRLPAGLAAGGGHRIHTFTSRADLAAKIAELPCGAFYSDSFFDTRLTRNGKGQFSLEFFEAGMAGAVRTLERLLGVCRMPFYGRYRRYLSGGGRRW